MAKRVRNKSVTKTEGMKGGKLIVQQLNILSADRTRKDIGDIKSALLSAESIHYPQRVRLYDVYDDAMLDGFLTGIINKRADAVLNKLLMFQNAAGKRVDEMDDLIQSNPFRELQAKILETQGWGITGLEFIPGAEFIYKEIPRKHIKPHKKIIAFDQYGEEGISYDGVSNLWIMGKENDLGYLLKCSFYAMYKRGGIGDYAQYVEIFGQPMRVIYYDAYDTKTKMELRDVLTNSGSALAMMVPKQAQFDVKDGKQSNANGDLQIKFLGFCDEEMSIIVLGNTETTKSSSSSGYAQSKEHGKQQLEITKSDLKYVQNMLNTPQFINILKSYGYPVDGGRFVFEKEIDIPALLNRIEIDEAVASHVPIDPDYWYETYGIPKPDNFDELMAQKEEERKAMLKVKQQGGDQGNGNDPQEDPASKSKPAPKKKPKPEDQKADNFWIRFRSQLADFFDPAP